jgi:exodeoxyribonuclease VII small subunit
MAKGKPKPPESLTFEEAFDELEGLVTELESGELKLEEALSVFERGQALAAHCSDLLEQAQLRLTALTPGEDDEPSPTEFEVD